MRPAYGRDLTIVMSAGAVCHCAGALPLRDADVMHPDALLTVIEVRRVSHRFGDRHALRSVDLDVPAGQVTAVLGTNGAGKSTLFDVLEGHIVPDQGSVRVFGEDPRDRRVARRRTGVVLQEGGTSPDLSVSQCLRVLGEVSGRRDDTSRVLALVGLTDHARRPVKALSGGERRRLDLAAALWGDPELLFLDEPTTGLDPSARSAIWSHVDALRAQGTTVVLSTHHLEEAERRADRIVLMHAGSIVDSGTTEDVLAREVGSVTFRSNSESAPVDLDATRGRDGRITVRTRDVQSTVRAILAWSDRTGADVADLTTAAPRLEDVFARLGQEQIETETSR